MTRSAPPLPSCAVRAARGECLPRSLRGGGLVDEYRSLRRQARRYRWYLEIQREAIGLRRHELLDELYPIPGE